MVLGVSTDPERIKYNLPGPSGTSNGTNIMTDSVKVLNARR